MIVEVLSFAGCPNEGRARRMAERVLEEVGVEAELRSVDVPDLETAARLGFLGSPTLRIDGRDVEPGAEERTDYLLGCRLFRTSEGLKGEPDERRVRSAVLEAASE